MTFGITFITTDLYVSPKLIARSLRDLVDRNADIHPLDDLVDKYNKYCKENRLTNDDMTYCKGFNKWLSDECWYLFRLVFFLVRHHG